MKSGIKIIIGLAIFLSAIVGYRNSFNYFYELTFLSNVSCGVLLILDGVLHIFSKKEIPVIAYQMVVLCTNVIFFTCVFTILGWHTFNFEGTFIFLHVINPPVFLLCYLFLTKLTVKNKKEYLKYIFVCPLLLMTYILFDYIRYLVTGNLVYGLINAENHNIISLLLIGFAFYLLMSFMSYGILKLKLFIQRKCFKS